MAPADETDAPKGGAKTPAAPKDDRQARLEAQLRANLKKRKAQARGRKSVRQDPAEKPDGPENA